MNVAEDLIKDKNRELLCIPAEADIAEAVQLMARENIGSLLVTVDGEIKGIWTERDLVHNIADNGFEIQTQPVREFMSSPVKSCRWDESVYSLMDKFLGLRIRHILVEKEGKFIGLLSSGDVMKAALRAKNHDLAQANAGLGWDYYEEWKYKPRS